MRLGSDRSAVKRGGNGVVAAMPTTSVETDGCSAGGTNGGDAPLDSVRRQQQPACMPSSPQALATWQGMGAASARGAQRTCKPLQAKASSRTRDVVKGRRLFIIEESLGYSQKYAYRRPTTQKSFNRCVGAVRERPYLGTILRTPRSYTTSYSPSGTSIFRTANSPIVTSGSDCKSSSSNDSSGVLPVVSKTIVRFW